MGKVIDSWSFALTLESIIKEQRQRYAGDETMAEVIDLLEIVRDMALEQPAAPALVLSQGEVQMLTNDTAHYIQHLQGLQGLPPQYGYEPRVRLLEKLQRFERSHYATMPGEDKPC